jgi:hypothetical protein
MTRATYARASLERDEAHEALHHFLARCYRGNEVGGSA